MTLSPAQGDCTPEDVLEQFEPLATLLVKLLNSVITPLRHIAQSAFLTVARSVWASGADPAVDLLNTTMQQLVITYFTKKNTRISQNFIEDLVLNRLSDVSVPVLWADLVARLSDEQLSSFKKQEVVHLFTSVLKKYNGLAVAAQDTLRAHFASGVLSLAAQLKAVTTTSAEGQSAQSNNNKTSSKKLKPLLGAIKDVTELAKKATPSASGDNSKVVKFENIATVRASIDELNQALSALSASLATSPAVAATPAEGEDTKKGNQKANHNGLLGQLKTIQTPLNAFLAAVPASGADVVAATAGAATPGKNKKDKKDKAVRAEKGAATPKKVAEGADSSNNSHGNAESVKKRKQPSAGEEEEEQEQEQEKASSSASAVKKDKKSKKEKK